MHYPFQKCLPRLGCVFWGYRAGWRAKLGVSRACQGRRPPRRQHTRLFWIGSEGRRNLSGLVGHLERKGADARWHDGHQSPFIILSKNEGSDFTPVWYEALNSASFAFVCSNIPQLSTIVHASGLHSVPDVWATRPTGPQAFLMASADSASDQSITCAASHPPAAPPFHRLCPFSFVEYV